MTPYVLSPRAQRDVEDIWNYTAQRWSVDQAETYVRALQQALHRLSEEPSRARSCEDIRAGYFKYLVGSHVIFFRTNAGKIDVSRILHEQMDFGRHF